MIYVREFYGTGGRPHQDHGETSADQILSVGECWILSDDGEEWMRTGGSEEHIVRIMVSLLEGEILEIGYGLGLSFSEIRKKVPSHDVIDIDPTIYELAKKNWPERYDDEGLRLIGDFNTDLPSKTYDSVYLDALDSVWKSKEAMNALRAVIRQGGFLVPVIDNMILDEKDLPALDGFVLDKTAKYDFLDGDPKYEKNIRKILKAKNELHRLDELVAKNERRHRIRGLVGRYRKT